MPPQPTRTISKHIAPPSKVESEPIGSNPGLSAVVISDPISVPVAQSITSIYTAKQTVQVDGGRDPFVKPGAP